MTHAIRIKNFHGDILWEDPEKFVDDIQFLADTWYGNQTDDAAMQRNTIRAFRQYLQADGDAYHWWSFIVSPDEKKDWKTIKTLFSKRYKHVADSKESAARFQLINEILSFRQGQYESIQDYVYRVERLSRWISESEQDRLAVVFIRGMKDEEERKLVFFLLKVTKELNMDGAIKAVKAAYREIRSGTEPFWFWDNMDHVRRPHTDSGIATLAPFMPLNTVNHVAGTEPATILQPRGNDGRPLSQKDMMNMFEWMKANGFKPPESNPREIHRTPSIRAQNVMCFRCGPIGHFQSESHQVVESLPAEKHLVSRRAE